MFEFSIQFFIFTLGTITVFLLNSKSKKHRKIGAIVGVCGQPFWFITSFMNGQWAIFLLGILYTIAYIRGIINNTKPQRGD